MISTYIILINMYTSVFYRNAFQYSLLSSKVLTNDKPNLYNILKYCTYINCNIYFLQYLLL